MVLRLPDRSRAAGGASLVFYGLPRAAWVDAAVARGANFTLRPVAAQKASMLFVRVGSVLHRSSELVASKLTAGGVRLRLASCETLGSKKAQTWTLCPRLAAQREQHAR